MKLGFRGLASQGIIEYWQAMLQSKSNQNKAVSFIAKENMKHYFKCGHFLPAIQFFLPRTPLNTKFNKFPSFVALKCCKTKTLQIDN